MATATEKQAQSDELARARALREQAGEAADGAEAELDPDEETIAAANELPDAEHPGDDSRSIEDIAAEQTPIPPTQLAIPGTGAKITLIAGGAPPTSSEARIMGSRRPIEGQYEKGEIITVVVECKVGAVEFIDTTDEWGNVQKTVRAHKLRMLAIKPITGSA